MRETWYVLEDDEVVDPAEVSMSEDGRLVHASGVAVAIRAGVPRSRGVDDPDAARAAAREEAERLAAEKKASKAKEREAAPEGEGEPAKTTREITAEKPKRGYKTRSA
jgi:hypothetical protein